MPLYFIGYCLPSISFRRELFTEVLYFYDAIFYGAAKFSAATFSKEANFSGATFSKEANFSGATFSDDAYFNEAGFLLGAYFSRSTFLSKAYFSGEFNGLTYFNYVIFEEPTKVAVIAAKPNTNYSKFIGLE